MGKRQTRDWFAIVQEQEQSGKSISDFCKEKDIHYTAFYKNRKIIKNSNFIEIKEKNIQRESIEDSPIILTYKDISIKVPSIFNKQCLKNIISVLEDI